MLPTITTEDEQKAQEPAENPLLAPSPPEQPDTESGATMEDALKNLRLRRFSYEMAPWQGEAQAEESAPTADSTPEDELTVDRGDEEMAESAPAAAASEPAETIPDAVAEEEKPEATFSAPFQRQEWSQDSAVGAEESESRPETESTDYVPAETPAEERTFAPANESPIALAAGATPSGDDRAEDFSVDPAEAARAAQAKVASEAAQQTGLLLEQVANVAVEQIRNLLGQMATSAIQQSNRAMVRMAEDAADQTGRVLERMAAEATSQVHQILKKIGDEQITPPLSASVEGLSDEVRRVGRELFKSARATERNQDLFDTAITELQRLTTRIEKVPSQLYGAESINEVKAAVCREMIGVADAMEASLATAEEILTQFQEPAETDEAGEEAATKDGRPVEAAVVEEPVIEVTAEEEADGNRAGVSPTGASTFAGDSKPGVAAEKPGRPDSWQDRFRDWLWRILPPPTPAPAPPPGDESNRVAELEGRLRQSWEAMNQWLDGQQLLYERLQTALRAVGVRQIETEGQMFDPSLHRAVSTEARNDVPAGMVTGEERKGYTLDGKILRYAEVIVAKNE
jgi:hypothetical protein